MNELKSDFVAQEMPQEKRDVWLYQQPEWRALLRELAAPSPYFRTVRL